MSIEADLPCVYRQKMPDLRKSCNCGEKGRSVQVYRCTQPSHKDFCTLYRYEPRQTERICQFCTKRQEDPLTEGGIPK